MLEQEPLLNLGGLIAFPVALYKTVFSVAE